jgi:hypothetical protein
MIGAIIDSGVPTMAFSATDVGYAVLIVLIFAVIAYAVVFLERRLKGAIYFMLGGVGLSMEMYAAWECARVNELTSYFSKWANNAKILVTLIFAYRGRTFLNNIGIDRIGWPRLQ